MQPKQGPCLLQRQPSQIRHYPTRAMAQEFMRQDALGRGHLLKCGVGNDMSTPFYVAAGRHAESYYPTGIPGRSITVTYDKD